MSATEKKTLDELETSSINVTDWKFPRLWRSLAFLCKEGRNAIGFRHPSVFSIKKSPVQSEVGPLSPWKARIASKPLFLLVHSVFFMVKSLFLMAKSFFSWSNSPFLGDPHFLNPRIWLKSFLLTYPDHWENSCLGNPIYPILGSTLSFLLRRSTFCYSKSMSSCQKPSYDWKYPISSLDNQVGIENHIESHVQYCSALNVVP